MKKICLFFVFILLFSLLLTSCAGSGSEQNQNGDNSQGNLQNPGDSSGGENNEGNNGSDEKVYYRVMVTVSEGASVTSENPIDVESGADAVFDIKIEPTHAFSSVSAGEYNQTSGKLTVKNVTKKMTVDFKTEKIAAEEVGKKYVFVFEGGEKDTSTVASFTEVDAGTLVTVNALDMTKNFLGWSFGKTVNSGGAIASEDREYTFRVTGDNANANGFVSIYPNYSSANVFYYDLGGAVVNTSTFNMTNNEFYTAEYSVDGRVKITLLDKYYNYAECASTFWDDGSFTKDGYILREYNTKADGSGEAYSLGSKYFPLSENGEAVLYCIWEKADGAALFEYTDYTYAKPAGINASIPWVENGVIITKCLSDAKRVVIPEKIGGKAVIAIAAGAFNSRPVETVVLPKTLQKIEDGAFVSCSSLSTMYFPDGIYSISDAVLDSASYTSFKNLIVNATVAPRYAKDQYGAFAVKFCRVLSAGNEKMIIFVAGSSTYQGLGTQYLEALLDGKYRVINYGTTRTRPGYLYMEALAHYTDSEDIMVFAPENSAFMLGENLINKDMILQLEGVNNLYRYIDISRYTGYFTGFSDFNKDRYTRSAVRYEAICSNNNVNKYGDYQHATRAKRETHNYIDAYYVTFNNRIKSIKEGKWSDTANQAANKDYKDLNNETWTSLDRPELLAVINSAIDKVKATGAKVYFAFAPTDANAIVPEARSAAKIDEYDALIASVYHFDGLLGKAKDYVYAHEYFYDCAYHVNDYGRTYRTYDLYCDIADVLKIESVKGMYSLGESFEGCLFEKETDRIAVDFLK